MPSSHTIKLSYSKAKKSSSSIALFLEEFFLENREALSQFYPGLRKDHFAKEFFFFSKLDHQNDVIHPSFAKAWESFFFELMRGLPFEYINKRAFFYESTFYVDERVLIPRFETEGLLEQALLDLKERSKSQSDEIKVCEVGIGPGTVSLSLLKAFDDNPVNCLGLDISQDALAVARINHFRLNGGIHLKHKITLFEGDRLFGVNEKFDLIISNPPYIKEREDKKLVHQKVLEFEPPIALFLEDDDYDDWFQLFFEQSAACLKAGGVFLMEGHEAHLEQLDRLCENAFTNKVEILKDLGGANRFLKVRKKNG